MKKVLLTIAAIALLAAPASAQMYSMWTDTEMSACNIAPPAVPGTMFHVFIIAEPNVEGIFGGEYYFPAVDGHFNLSSTPNPVLSAALIGQWYGGTVGITFGTLSCQSSAFWVVDMFMMASTPAYYQILPNLASGLLAVNSCIGNRLPLDAAVYNDFGVFNPCVVGTEETSWGAIKSMMD